LLNFAASGETIRSISDIGSSASPVCSASRCRTDCRNTGSEKMTPFWASMSTPMTVAPATNSRFWKRRMETSGVPPRRSSLHSHAAKRATMARPRRSAIGAMEIGPGCHSGNGLSARSQP